MKRKKISANILQTELNYIAICIEKQNYGTALALITRVSDRINEYDFTKFI